MVKKFPFLEKIPGGESVYENAILQITNAHQSLNEASLDSILGKGIATSHGQPLLLIGANYHQKNALGLGFLNETSAGNVMNLYFHTHEPGEKASNSIHFKAPAPSAGRREGE